MSPTLSRPWIANTDLKGRFQPTTDIAGQTPVKSSVQRGIRSTILSSWKIDAETLEEIWPKKESIVHVKWSVPRPYPTSHPHALRCMCSFLYFFGGTPETVESISPYTLCTASRSFSSTLTDHTFPLCAFSTNASFHHLTACAPARGFFFLLHMESLLFSFFGRSVRAPTRPHRSRCDPLPPRGREHDVSRPDVRGRVAPAGGRGVARGDPRRVGRGGQGVRGRDWGDEAWDGADEGSEQGHRRRVDHVRRGRIVGRTEAVKVFTAGEPNRGVGHPQCSTTIAHTHTVG